ncbi:MAG: anthranilate synthase component I [Endozoicomonadaceae bacterium]|nr:anthranilate synthase component I [Endozoicomonadaceae bacterium]MCY4329330.1 anthranilate synthase component I [Endozoicomonadaceae bacterium]
MTLKEIESLSAQGYNRVPLAREILCDLETPLSAYLKLANHTYSYLLESVERDNKWGRYSLIGLDCTEVIKFYGYTMIHETGGKIVKKCEVQNPLQAIHQYIKQFKVADLPDTSFFNGGLVGYFGYDTVRYTETHLWKTKPKDELNVPDILLMLSDNFVIFDNLSGTTKLVTFIDPGKKEALTNGEAKLNHWIDLLNSALAPKEQGYYSQSLSRQTGQDLLSQQINYSMPRNAYECAVKKIKDYTVAGDIMQVVSSHRMSVDFSGEPINIYRALRASNPSPYMSFMNLKDFYIVGSSPETLCRLENGEIMVRPLAGTRRRGKDAAEDSALEKDLLNDPKEIAEHLMLIDLGRNDVGRIAETGSVKVTEQMVTEHYSHVMHISSTIVGKLKAGLNPLDVLVSILPAGTLSGAPKIRAMEIIDELEPVKRGIYGGAIGYLSWNGNMDMALALRTAVIKDGKLYNQAGAGIVHDSDPATEWEETMNKSRAIFDALSRAQQEF